MSAEILVIFKANICWKFSSNYYKALSVSECEIFKRHRKTKCFSMFLEGLHVESRRFFVKKH